MPLFSSPKQDLSLYCEGKAGTPRLEQCVACVHMLIGNDKQTKSIPEVQQLMERFKIPARGPPGIPVWCKRYFKPIPISTETITRILAGQG